MKLMIEGGRWTIVSDDLRVHLQIHPRRSLLGEQTRILIRAEPMPLRVYEPETLTSQPTHASAWVWEGTHEHARTLVMRMLDVLRSHFQGLPTDSTVGRWRTQVIDSLYPPAQGDTRQESTSRRA